VGGYERAGAAAIQFEDQKNPAKCGHTPNRHLVPTKDMANRLAVASDARSSRDFLIVARTDARTSLGPRAQWARRPLGPLPRQDSVTI
jgi:2,3-dimethylmalate lyase